MCNLVLLYYIQTILNEVEQCRQVDDNMESPIDSCLQNTLDKDTVDAVLQSVTCDAADKYDFLS